MKINIIKIIDTENPEEPGWTKKEVSKKFRPTTLYQIEKRKILEIVRKGKHIRYLMERTEYEIKNKI